jgi:phage/plasmid-associated DNA primase
VEALDDRARRLSDEIAERVGVDLREQLGEIVFTDGDFWRYAESCWQAIEHQVMRCMVHEYDGALYETAAGSEAAVQLSRGRVDSVLHEMGAKLAQPDFFVDASPGINCASGFIAFAADGLPTLLPHDPDHRCRHVLPGRWQQGGIDAENPPPDSLLGRLLHGVFKGDHDARQKRELLAEVTGAGAVGYGTKLREPKAAVCIGEKAGNGKSQTLDAMRSLLPASAISSVPANKFGDERFIIGLRGKLLNASDELSGQAIASDTFKSVITGNPVPGRDVYRSAIEFRPVAQQVFAVNRLPKFGGGMDRGVRRRLLPITFNRVIPIDERVEDIGLRVGREEPDLLLAFAVAGAERLIRQREFTIPASSKSALQQWVYRDNPVRAWITARVDPADPPPPGQQPMQIKSRLAYAQFREWAVAEGFAERDLPDPSGFVQRLKENEVVPGITIKHKKSGNWLVGLAILATDRSSNDDAEVLPADG